MTNHPNRGKLNRNALDLIAKFSAAGYSLALLQQSAANDLCRAAATWHRLQTERCNGDWPLRLHDQEAWNAELEKQEARARDRIGNASEALPCRGVSLSGDPRGATVKLVMADPVHHDDMGRTGLCVPGS